MNNQLRHHKKLFFKQRSIRVVIILGTIIGWYVHLPCNIAQEEIFWMNYKATRAIYHLVVQRVFSIELHDSHRI